MTTKPQSDWDFSLTSYCECITVVDRNVGRTCDMLLTNRNDKGDGTSALSLCYTAEDSVLLAVLLSDLGGVLWLWRSKLLWGGPRGQELHVGSPSELRATSTPHSVLPQVLNALHEPGNRSMASADSRELSSGQPWVAALQGTQLNHRSYHVMNLCWLKLLNLWQSVSCTEK